MTPAACPPPPVQVFTDEFHLFTLSPFLSATAALHPRVNIKSIVIALIDRLASYAAREAENESPEDRKRGEEDAAKRLSDKISARKRLGAAGEPKAADKQEGADVWGGGGGGGDEAAAPPAPAEGGAKAADGGEGKPPAEGEAAAGAPVRKFRGIPENVKLFEVFWQQVVELIKARPDLPIQDITALLVSLANLSLSCYPDQLEYVDQVLAFARAKVTEYNNSADLYTPTTASNLLALLLSPINSYATVLTLLAIPSYLPLLLSQPFGSRRSIAHGVVSSVLKNETVIDSPDDVEGVLGMCSVLIRDQRDPAQAAGSSTNGGGGGYSSSGGRRGQVREYDAEDLAEEQGWVARMVHLFRSDDLDVQFQVRPSLRASPWHCTLTADASPSDPHPPSSCCKRRASRSARAATASAIRSRRSSRPAYSSPTATARCRTTT